MKTRAAICIFAAMLSAGARAYGWTGAPWGGPDFPAFWPDAHDQIDPHSQLWWHAAEVYDVAGNGTENPGYSQDVSVAFGFVYVTNFLQDIDGVSTPFTFTNTVLVYTNLDHALDIRLTNSRNLGPYSYTWGPTSGAVRVAGSFEFLRYLDQIFVEKQDEFVASWLKNGTGDFNEYFAKSHTFSNHPSRFEALHPWQLPANNIAGILLDEGLTNSVILGTVISNYWGAIEGGYWGQVAVSNQTGPITLAEAHYLPRLEAGGFPDPTFNGTFTWDWTTIERADHDVRGHWDSSPADERSDSNTTYASFNPGADGKYEAGSNNAVAMGDVILYTGTGPSGTWYTVAGSNIPTAWVRELTNAPGTWIESPGIGRLRSQPGDSFDLWLTDPAMRPRLYFQAADTTRVSTVDAYIYGDEYTTNAYLSENVFGSLMAWSNTYSTVSGTNGLQITNLVGHVTQLTVDGEANWRDTVAVRWPASPSFISRQPWAGWWLTHQLEQRRLWQDNFEIRTMPIAFTNVPGTNVIYYSWEGFGWDMAKETPTNSRFGVNPDVLNWDTYGGGSTIEAWSESAAFDATFHTINGTHGQIGYWCVTNSSRPGWEWGAELVSFSVVVQGYFGGGGFPPFTKNFDVIFQGVTNSGTISLSNPGWDNFSAPVPMTAVYPSYSQASDTAGFSSFLGFYNISIDYPDYYIQSKSQDIVLKNNGPYTHAVRKSSAIKMTTYTPAAATNGFMNKASRKQLYLRFAPVAFGTNTYFDDEGHASQTDGTNSMTSLIYEETGAGYPEPWTGALTDAIPFENSPDWSRGWKLDRRSYFYSPGTGRKPGFWTVDFGVEGGFKYRDP